MPPLLLSPVRLQDIGDLSNTVNTEVAALRQEFAELKGIIKQQIDRTASLTMAQQVSRCCHSWAVRTSTTAMPLPLLTQSAMLALHAGPGDNIVLSSSAQLQHGKQAPP